jgi:hypothetical protein
MMYPHFTLVASDGVMLVAAPLLVELCRDFVILSLLQSTESNQSSNKRYYSKSIISMTLNAIV